MSATTSSRPVSPIVDLPTLREYCLGLPGVSEDTPFGPETLVFRVGGKLFALSGMDNVPTTVNLKCDPERALDLRDQYDAIQPGWHMNKKHWNTVTIDASLPAGLVRELVDHSYALVVRSLKRSERALLEAAER